MIHNTGNLGGASHVILIDATHGALLKDGVAGARPPVATQADESAWTRGHPLRGASWEPDAVQRGRTALVLAWTSFLVPEGRDRALRALAGRLAGPAAQCGGVLWLRPDGVLRSWSILVRGPNSSLTLTPAYELFDARPELRAVDDLIEAYALGLACQRVGLGTVGLLSIDAEDIAL